MLVLSRRRNQTIRINDDISITVLEIREGKVRLGITAPRHIDIHRLEVYNTIQQQLNADAEFSETHLDLSIEVTPTDDVAE